MINMPKRSLDIDNSGLPASAALTHKVQRKTDRSHEENQERAYIAASRRADRSIEARVQSARMASEIHKRRTGKAFRITEQIVRNEEMYEEEEDDFPRSVYILGPHLQTQNNDLSSRVEAYLSNRMAMSAYMRRANEDWQSNQIHELFAQSFPNANQQAQRLSQSMASQPAPNQAMSPRSPAVTDFKSINYQQSPAWNDEQSASAISPDDQAALSPPTPASPPPAKRRALQRTPAQGLDFGQNTDSPFTADLPAEAKMLLGAPGIGLDDSTFGAPSFYEQSWMNPNTLYSQPDLKLGEIDPALSAGAPWEPSAEQQTALEQQIDENWDQFINDTPWGGDHE